MKKVFALFLSLVMALSVTGCKITIDGEERAKPSVTNGTIGLSVSTQNNPFFVTLVEGAEEAAEKHGVKLTVADAAAAVKVTGAGFSFNASHYTQEELTNKGHNFELEKVEETVLCIDFAMSGVGTGSCGPVLLPQYHVPHELDFDVVVEL